MQASSLSHSLTRTTLLKLQPPIVPNGANRVDTGTKLLPGHLSLGTSHISNERSYTGALRVTQFTDHTGAGRVGLASNVYNAVICDGGCTLETSLLLQT
jgi:hypothetical protein